MKGCLILAVILGALANEFDLDDPDPVCACPTEADTGDDIIKEELNHRSEFDKQYRKLLMRLLVRPHAAEIGCFTREAAKEITYRLAFDKDHPSIYKTPGERQKAYQVFLPPGLDPARLKSAAMDHSMQAPLRLIPRLFIREVTEDLPAFPEVQLGIDENEEPVAEPHPYRRGRWFYVEIHVSNSAWFGPAALGIVATDMDEQNVKMVSLWVADSLRGRGYGTQLIESAGQRWPDLRWTDFGESRPFHDRLVEGGIAKPKDRSGYYQFVPKEERQCVTA